MQTSLHIAYDTCETPEELSKEDRALLEEAWEATKTSYSPYSKFKVGAAVRLKTGEIILGSNQENAAYPSGLCAERTALFAVGAQGKGREVTAIAIVGTGEDFDTTEPVTPCGGCRQVIKEFEDLSKNKLTLIMSGKKGKIYRFEGIDSLLPFGFGPKDLGM